VASSFISKVILKNKDVRYRAVITRSGRNIKSKTFRKRSDAKGWGIRYVLSLEKHEAKGIRECTVRFNDLVGEYMYQWAGKDHDRARLVHWWVAQFGSILLSDITTNLIRDKLKPHRSKSPATYNRYKATLSALFKFAIIQNDYVDDDQYYIVCNPCDEVRALPENNQRVRYLTDDEKVRLLKSANEIGGKFRIKLLLALTTGMRKGELDQLRWGDLDFERGLAELHDTKNGSPRHTPIPNTVMTEVKKYREVGNGLLFPSIADSEKKFDYRKQWLRCLKLAGITDFRWHDMRHDTASTLARDGRTLKEIAEILGHKSLASTNRYAHLCTEHKVQLLNDTMNKMIIF